MSKATYYVEVDTYWQNSASYFVGPFETSDQAEQWINATNGAKDANVWRSDSHCGGDIKSAWRVYAPVSATTAKRRGLRINRNDLPISTKCTAKALDRAVRECNEVGPY